eukprot:scaffold811_cov498-Pavlova_lutheri.AAC.1
MGRMTPNESHPVRLKAKDPQWVPRPLWQFCGRRSPKCSSATTSCLAREFGMSLHRLERSFTGTVFPHQ